MRGKTINKDGSKVILSYKSRNELSYDLIDRKKGLFLSQFTSQEMDDIVEFVKECKIADKEEMLHNAKKRYEVTKLGIENDKILLNERLDLLKNMSIDTEEHQFLSEKITRLNDLIDLGVNSLDSCQKEIKELEEEIKRLKTTF